jgi:hypothetical protein
MKTCFQQFGGVFLLLFGANAPASTHYVDSNSPNATPPYTNWATAAATIQDAVDAAAAGDQILATNGVYQTGGRAVFGTMTNRVVVNKPVTVQSVNGAAFTLIVGHQVPDTINGDGAMRCVYLTNGASLCGFTLTNGATRLSWGDSLHEQSGGGVWCESEACAVSNCLVTGNAASSRGGGIWSGTIYDSTLSGNCASSSYYTSDASGGGASGGTLYNCVVLSNTAYFGGGGAFQSTLHRCALRGNSSITPSFGVGGGVFECVLTDCTLAGNSANYGAGAYGSQLSECNLDANSALSNGGGVGASMVSNCTLTANSAFSGGGAGSDSGGNPSTLYNCVLAHNSAATGGGAQGSVLNNCTVVSNTATSIRSYGGYGGGVYSCFLNITGNLASFAGGAYEGSLRNCIVYFNAASNELNFNYESLLDYCCTTPLPTNGVGNITNAPKFVDQTAGDLRLQSNSPCINAGNNAYAQPGPDLDGNPRIVGGTVDIGAYEFQTPASVISYAWLQQYGLPTDGSADYIDSDGDGMNNRQEWIAGTDPTKPSSVLRMLVPASATNGPGITVTWQSVSGKTYSLERSTNLRSQPAFSVLQSSIVGQDTNATYTDTNAVGPGPFFYRVGVQ